ncbi:PHP domain-containing protein [Paenibacillus sp. NEAU-GSW1]|uniref:PHP-associated domain-containing protein n=1 Tax=Paenibacillus sp. NEAU-GSW1 TaxID=2682486 RepID=UPI0012E1A07C|nr:PHP domain-containing protein [Paenibacillus sp. NEAU-GSW1]MUT67937.1 PHP domain-containing protein [Paenibacillus sp. NEAU-GSW1]
MKIDLHTHGKLSKKTEFSLDYFLSMAREAKANGLDAVALTEHFNTHRFFDMVNQLNRHFDYVGDHYIVEGLKVFSGMEIDVLETGHILAIGNRRTIRELRLQLEPYSHKEEFIPFETLLDWTDNAGLLRIGAHPMRESTPLIHHSPVLLQRLDGFDVNAKDLYAHGPEMANRVRAFASSLGLPVFAGSDSHQPLQFGSVLNQLKRDCETAEQLRGELLSGAYEIHISPCLDVKVKAAQMMKELLKQTMAIA